MKTITPTKKQLLLQHLRLCTAAFISLLVLSGITAFPLRTEIVWLQTHAHLFSLPLQVWIHTVALSIAQTPDVVLYGTDWLAFAHIIIALFFIPFYRQPLQYRFNLYTGMIACLLVFPLAFICGPIRGIPLFHQLIDCSFGLCGFALLYYIYLLSKKLEA